MVKKENNSDDQSDVINKNGNMEDVNNKNKPT